MSIIKRSKVIQVAGGNCYSKAIVQYKKGNKTLWIIGKNTDGQFGLGNTDHKRTSQNSGLKNVTLVACRNSQASCISDNYLYVAGKNSSGQLGLGYKCHYVNKWTKTVYGNISALAANGFRCMFVSNGTLWEIDPNTLTFTPTQTNSVTKIACGGGHSMYIGDNDTNLYVKGYNNYGQLGIGSYEKKDSWTKVTNISAQKIIDIALGGDFSIIIAYGPFNSNPNYPVCNWLWVTGRNFQGSIGLPQSTENINAWQQLALGYIDSIACTVGDSLFTSGGYLFGTGGNSFGQLGLGDRNPRYGFVQTQYGNITGKIAGGAMHALFISQNNCWAAGSNIVGELGVPSFKDQYSVWFLMN